MKNNPLERIKTSPYLLARHSMYAWCMLFNKEIEPRFNYRDKFFTILNAEFSAFEKSEIELLLLEASPRTGKTDFIINIFLPWLLGVKNHQRFIIAVSNDRLKKLLRRKLERVLKSWVYEKVFPSLKIETCNESEMVLSNSNTIDFTTTGATVPIGAGFHWMFFIDFLSAETMRSEALKEEAFAKMQDLTGRIEHTPKTKIVVDNQRLGVEDLSWLLTSQYDEVGLEYVRLTFPYQFDDVTEYPLLGRKIIFDKFEYLTTRFNEMEKRKIIAKRGQFIYETQYLQRPRRARGDMVKREMFKYYGMEDLQSIEFRKAFIITDLALEAGKRNDYNVFIFFAVDNDDNLYVLDMIRVKMKGIEADTALYHFYKKWENGFNKQKMGPSFIGIENVGASKMTIQKYKKGFMLADGTKVYLGGLVKEIVRGGKGSKFARFMNSLPHIQAGKVFLPSHEVVINGVNNVIDEINEPLIREHENFREDDSHDYDDICDVCSDGIREARRNSGSLSVGF